MLKSQNRDLEIAASRIINTDMTIDEVAKSVGYSSPSEFSADFLRRWELPPSEFRRQKGRHASYAS